MALRALIPQLLAQESGSYSAIFFWLAVVVLLITAGAVGVMYLRKWLKDEEVPVGKAAAIGFTLSDLRQLHREGKMTDEEFERARAKMVAAGKAAADKLPDPLAGRRRPDASQNRPQPPPNQGDSL